MKQQLEIALQTNNKCNRPRRSRERRMRAHWWFDQMRAVVDGATDWKPAGPPEQGHTHLTLHAEKP